MKSNLKLWKGEKCTFDRFLRINNGKVMKEYLRIISRSQVKRPCMLVLQG